MRSFTILLALVASASAVQIDGENAQLAGDSSSLIKREHIQSSCNSVHDRVVLSLSNCQKLASSCADAVSSGNDALVDKYFGNHTQSARKFVSDIYRKIARECSTTNGGQLNVICDPQNTGECKGKNIFANTGGTRTLLCKPTFDRPDKPSQNSRITPATIFIHELTHAAAIISATHDNLKGWGRNAMNYGHFAEEWGLRK